MAVDDILGRHVNGVRVIYGPVQVGVYTITVRLPRRG